MKPRHLLTALLCTAFLLPFGCAEKKKTTKMTVEGPEKKHEVKVETTEKK